jgi:CheY-like chemotaxis protein
LIWGKRDKALVMTEPAGAGAESGRDGGRRTLADGAGCGCRPVSTGDDHQDGPVVLHVDDDPQVGPLVATFLEREADTASVLTETDGDRALEHLERGEVDCLVTDIEMPGTDGIDLLRALAENDRELPVVVFSSHQRKEVAEDLPADSITEYVTKHGGHETFRSVAAAVADVLA